MKPVATPSARPQQAQAEDVTRKQIRSSGMLLTGRSLTIGVNFAIQVLIVRALSTLDYGAFAYALSVAVFLQAGVTLGLREAISRFVPMYHAQHEYGKLFGTIVLALSTVALVGLVIMGAFLVLPAAVTHAMGNAQQPRTLLAIMIFLVPFEALDGVLMGLFAAFEKPRAIFFRRYVLGSGLKLGVVLLLIVWQRDVIFLAYGYLIATATGVLIYAGMLLRLFARQRLFQHCHWRAIVLPVRELGAFTVPVFVSHLLLVAMQTISVMLLGHFHTMQEVALFQVVLPAANMITTVMTSFTLFYMPAAARLYAQNAYDDLREIYRQTAIWMAVLSFPIFAVTFVLAQPLVVWLYGTRYALSGTVLAVLAVGYYVPVTLGFNAMTLKALGKLRYLLAIDALAVTIAVALHLLLIPRYGALGAAIGTAGAMIIHDVLRQIGLSLALGHGLFGRPYSAVYLTLAGSTVVLFLMQFFRTSSQVALPLVGLVTAGVLLMSWQQLQVAAVFPELLRLPVLRRCFGRRQGRGAAGAPSHQHITHGNEESPK